ncbi:eukaryotic translation elongation factor 1 delta b (guanine nucleotide exchange protein) isoform X3 [Hemitrygon akajei]|uniref:eukaryotic translation elongation factor 1 delta b (guanine nucleotide exchange protein) isoform X3 n=1 Tax=Hemitrygon akajei TaxID=2704970 RepID=UPI003BF99871
MLNILPTGDKYRALPRMGTVKHHPFLLETIWTDKWKFDEAERLFWEVWGRLSAPEIRPPTEEMGDRRRGKGCPWVKPVPTEGLDGAELRAPSEAKSDRGKSSATSRPAVACHHLVGGVWVNKDTFDTAERLFVERLQVPSVPRSLPILGSRVILAPRATPDEGYISATPGTPLTPGSRVSGIPHETPWCLPLPGVWLEKPLYDDAERLYQEALCQERASERNGRPPGQCCPRARHPCPPHPAESHPSPVVALSPAAVHQHLIHQDNEPVWFSKPAYDAAELCYHLCGIRGMPSKSREVAPATPQAAPAERPPSAPRSPWLQDKTMAVNFLTNENIWFDKYKYDDAEVQYYQHLHGSVPTNTPVENTARDSPAVQISSVCEAGRNPKETVRDSVEPISSHSAIQGADNELCSRVTSLEKENQNLHKEVEELRLTLSKLELRLSTMEKSLTSTKPVVPAPTQPSKPSTKQPEEDDDDLDLFGSSDEEESAESERVREERLRQYAEKKSKKPTLIAKSSILLDVKPWDDETDMAKLEECVRTVQMDGLVWGASKLVPVGYGIRKLQIQCVVEDDKVGTDELEEQIIQFEDYVQSVDVAAFNKV